MQKTKFKQTGIGKKDFIGAWRITKMSDFDNDYVNEEVKAFIKVEKSGMGEFHFGLVQGSMSGDFKKNRARFARRYHKDYKRNFPPQ